MGLLEIVLLAAGTVILILGFILPVKKEETSAQTKAFAQEEIKNMVIREMDNVKSHVEDVVEESIDYAMEKTERSLERLSNEKIMAVNEYSDTVLKEIHKNHEEVMFLYDMLNDKQAYLKNAMSEVNRTVKAVEETKAAAEAAAKEAEDAKVPAQEAEAEITRKKVASASQKAPSKAPSRAAAKKDTPGQSQEKVVTAGTGRQITELNFSGRDTDGGSGRNSNEKILELHRQGKSTVAIAKELGLGVGEVKLVIDLFKNL